MDSSLERHPPARDPATAGAAQPPPASPSAGAAAAAAPAGTPTAAAAPAAVQAPLSEGASGGAGAAAVAAVPGGAHPLSTPYSFYFVRKQTGEKSADSYERSLKHVATFTTVEDFWNAYTHMVRPLELPNSCDYFCFKRGTKPMWEDDANRNGGKWIVRLKKGLASICWENLLLAFIGEQFGVEEEINGLAVSIRYHEDNVSVWNRDANNKEALVRTRDALQRVIDSLPNNAGASVPELEFKRHDQSLAYHSTHKAATQDI